MGTTDILSPGRGSFSPPDDSKAFGEALGHFINHPAAWRHLYDDAPAYAQEWTDVAMASRLAQLYRQLTGQPNGVISPLTVAA
jgi:hypothetical protein